MSVENEKRWDVLRAAVKYADLEMLSMSVAAPAAGLASARSALLASVRSLIGVEPGRASEYGHVSYRMMKYKEEAEASAQEVRNEIERYREALTRIANEDYRGNRPESATIAWRALQPTTT